MIFRLFTKGYKMEDGRKTTAGIKQGRDQKQRSSN
jgi:hypothetical protein